MARPAQPVPLRYQHFHHLSASGIQGVEFLGVGVGQRANGRTDRLGKMGDDLGVQHVGLGPAASGLGEVAHLAGIDHHRQGR